MRHLACALCTLTFVSSAHAQDLDPAKVALKVERLGGSVAVLRSTGGDAGPIGNIGVSFGDDGVFLIDDQLAPLNGKIRAALDTLDKRPVRFVFNTHWHGDHTDGNERLALQGAVIVAHDNVRRRLSSEQFSSLWKEKTPPSPPKALPVITFNDELSFFLNGDEVRVLHVAHAHTDGDSIVVFKKANVVHMGDTFFTSGYPYIDVDSGGTIDGYLAAADRVLTLADDATRIIPGHGATGDRKLLKAWRDMLASFRDRIGKLKAQGKTLAQVLAAKPTADHDAALGRDMITPEQLVDTIYQTIDGPRRPSNPAGKATPHH